MHISEIDSTAIPLLSLTLYYRSSAFVLLQQEELLDIQHQISDVSERVEEKEEELADLKGEKTLLQERHQKLITECQEVLSQKQGLLLQLQGGKTPGAGEGSHGAKPNFTCLNEKEQELVS